MLKYELVLWLTSKKNGRFPFTTFLTKSRLICQVVSSWASSRPSKVSVTFATCSIQRVQSGTSSARLWWCFQLTFLLCNCCLNILQFLNLWFVLLKNSVVKFLIIPFTGWNIETVSDHHKPPTKDESKKLEASGTPKKESQLAMQRTQLGVVTQLGRQVHNSMAGWGYGFPLFHNS